jgi:lysozyme family protein
VNANVLAKIDAIIQREGGYSNNPHDKGGETIYGITVAVARAFGYVGLMREMPRQTAVDIYTERYWLQPHFDLVDEISPLIADELFDTGVNMGQTVGGKFLQRALNVLNKRASLFPDLVVDGVIGKMSIYALRTFLDARGAEGQDVLLEMLNAQQSVRYIEIAEANSTQEDFEFGWQKNRVVEPA